MEQPKTINLDGESYEVAKFSQGVQQAVGIYNKFNLELQDEQLAVMKTQAAMQQVGAQISEAVKKELAEQAEQAAAGVQDAEEKPVDESGGFELKKKKK